MYFTNLTIARSYKTNPSSYWVHVLYGWFLGVFTFSFIFTTFIIRMFNLNYLQGIELLSMIPMFVISLFSLLVLALLIALIPKKERAKESQVNSDILDDLSL